MKISWIVLCFGLPWLPWLHVRKWRIRFILWLSVISVQFMGFPFYPRIAPPPPFKTRAPQLIPRNLTWIAHPLKTCKRNVATQEWNLSPELNSWWEPWSPDHNMHNMQPQQAHQMVKSAPTVPTTTVQAELGSLAVRPGWKYKSRRTANLGRKWIQNCYQWVQTRLTKGPLQSKNFVKKNVFVSQLNTAQFGRLSDLLK